MAKTNNKGFSLIEIIIAVAILSILLTPIIRQFANTMETSRKAKALQEANEKASYEIEEFQSLSKKELDNKYDTSATAGKTSIVEYKKKAKLVDMAGQPIMNGTSEAEVSYTIYQYNLEDSKVGAKNDNYSNKVMLDDLALQIRSFGGDSASAKHYKIAYGLTKADLAGSDALSDFTITNEGAAVEYDADGHVKTIVCTDKNSDTTDVAYIQNPNTVNLGNMHDLDKNKMALILGGTSSYDSEAYAALYSKAMDHLKGIDRNSWEQALLNVDSESILSQDALNASKRLIKIYADQPDPDKQDYVVKVDVYYIYKYGLKINKYDADGNVTSSTVQQFTDTVNYTVYSQKFTNMEKAPEIYFEYQPYCLSGDTTTSNIGDVTYQADDYILFDNYVDECKLYLYKPYRDQMNADANSKNKSNETKYSEYADAKEAGFTYYTDKTHTKKVTIHLATKTSNTSKVKFDENGNCEPDNEIKRLYIYTNIYEPDDPDKIDEKTKKPYNLDIDGYRDGEQNGEKRYQFVSDEFPSEFAFVAGKKDNTTSDDSDELSASYKKYALPSVYKTSIKDGASYKDGEDINVLYKIGDDERTENRVYTVTVTLEPDNNSLNTIRLSGAKGAN